MRRVIALLGDGSMQDLKVAKEVWNEKSLK